VNFNYIHEDHVGEECISSLVALDYRNAFCMMLGSVHVISLFFSILPVIISLSLTVIRWMCCVDVRIIDAL